MHGIFISYRRSDSEAYAGRVYDRLVSQFGKDEVFKDVDSMPMGVDFRKTLNSVIGRCQAVLVVVGPNWTNTRDPTGSRRLDNPDDFVRIELEAALAREIAVVPLLVAGAAMPDPAQLPGNLAAFAFRHATQVRPDPDFHHDMDRVIAALQPLIAGESSSSNTPVIARAPGTANIPRTNLPRNRPALIGRAHLVASVQACVAEHAVITLVGFGGLGKTRLAQHVGTELLASFPHGVWFVDLAGLSGDGDLLPTIARTLRIREYSSESLDVTLATALRDQEMLLILDNCERHTQSIATFVEEIIALAPQIKFLATSRSPLGIYGEKIVRIQGLEESEAVALFKARALEAGAEFNLDGKVVADLCRRLDHVPLAIELAAAQVRSLTPQEILSLIEDRLGVLRATDRRTTRHQTLDALVAWSYDLLSDLEKCLLNRLSVFVGSFDLASTKQVCVGTLVAANDTLDLIDRLVDKSLVSSAAIGGTTRFRLLEAVREFAARRLDASGETRSVLDRHTLYFSAQAQSLGELIGRTDTRSSSAALSFEMDNINAVIDRLGNEGQHAKKARLVVALNVFWGLAAPGTGQRRYKELMGDLDQLEPELRLSTLIEAASFFSNLGFASHATGLLDRAHAFAKSESLEISPFYYYVAAAVAEMDNRPADVLSLCDTGAAIIQEGDDFTAITLRLRSLTSIAKLRPAEALDHARTTLQQAQALGLELFVAASHFLIGTVLMLQGRIDESDAELTRAIDLAGKSMPQVTIAAMVASAAGFRTLDAVRSIERVQAALAVETQSEVMPWFRVVAGDILAWHWARGSRADDAVLVLAAMDELRRRLGFQGIWWARVIHDEAWESVRQALPAARISQLTARGQSLMAEDVRRLLTEVGNNQ